MVFGSDQSVRLVMDKLPGLEIHGQNPVVTTCTKHNLNVFEKATESDLRFGRHRSEETSDSDNSMGTNKAFTGKVFFYLFWLFFRSGLELIVLI